MSEFDAFALGEVHQENSAIMADFVRFFESEEDLESATNIHRVADIYLTQEARVVSIDILSRKDSAPLVLLGDTKLADEVVPKEVWATKTVYGPSDLVVQLGLRPNVVSHLRGLNSGYVVAGGDNHVLVGCFFFDALDLIKNYGSRSSCRFSP